MQQPNQKVVLKFPNLNLLWQFAQTLPVKSFEIDAARRTLYCECHDLDTERAVEHFKATVIRAKDQTDNS